MQELSKGPFASPAREKILLQKLLSLKLKSQKNNEGFILYMGVKK